MSAHMMYRNNTEFWSGFTFAGEEKKSLNKAILCFKCFLFFISSLNTPPGTKVKLLGTVQIKNGLLLLDDSKISVLGGVVEHMVEKWELQRVSCHFCHSDSPTLIKTAKGTNGHLMIVLVYSHWLISPAFLQSLAKHSRSNIGAEGGPPPFVPFGQVSAAQVWAALVCGHFDQTFSFFFNHRVSCQLTGTCEWHAIKIGSVMTNSLLISYLQEERSGLIYSSFPTFISSASIFSMASLFTRHTPQIGSSLSDTDGR